MKKLSIERTKRIQFATITTIWSIAFASSQFLNMRQKELTRRKKTSIGAIALALFRVSILFI
jgi:hypothetical protein